MLGPRSASGKRIMLRFALVLLLSLLSSSPALAEKRVALVIDNSSYQHTPRLANPKKDANDMAAALKKLRFTVLEGLDLDKAGIERKVRDFADFCYSRH
jgi:Caspase domain